MRPVRRSEGQPGQDNSEQTAAEPLSLWQWGLLTLGMAVLAFNWKWLVITCLLIMGWALDEGPSEARLWLGERVLALEPNQPQALVLLAETQQQKGHFAAAWPLWERALAQTKAPSEQAWLHLQLGQLNLSSPSIPTTTGLTATGHLVGSPGSGGSANAEARLKHLNRALSLDPDLEEAWFARGLFKAREQGDCRGARADLEKACRLGYKPRYGPVNLEMCQITDFSC
ncbi:MAG: hypothetical protein AB7I41_18690 [Candidatus Sericytochromatia bacterium]